MTLCAIGEALSRAPRFGSVAEWIKALAWKASEAFITPPQVRILSLPRGLQAPNCA